MKPKLVTKEDQVRLKKETQPKTDYHLDTELRELNEKAEQDGNIGGG